MKDWIDIDVDGGRMAAFVARPAKPGPGLVMLQEIFGVNPAMQEKARKFAAAGFTVAVPDLFWRMNPRISLAYNDTDRAAAFGYWQKFDYAAGNRDIAAAGRWLERETDGKVGVIGFCLGGKLAVASTAAYPFAAVCSVYGVKLDEDPERLKAIQAPLQVHVGDADPHVPMDQVRRVQDIVKGMANVEVFVYPGAKHGYFNPVRAEVFAPEAAAQTQRRAEDMFRRALAA